MIDLFKTVSEQTQILMGKSKIGNISKFDSAYCLIMHYLDKECANELDIIGEREVRNICRKL